MTIERPMFPPLVPVASPASRRAVLFGLAAGVAAGPAVALPLLGAPAVPSVETSLSGLAPAVAAPSEVDPILAVIKRHMRAVRAHNKAEIAFRSHEHENKLPRVLIGEYPEHKRVTLISNDWEQHYRYEPTGKMLPAFARFKYELEEYALANLDEVERTKWVNKKYRELRRAGRAYSNSPRSRAYDEWCERGEEVARINKELFATTPTTMAGVAALLAHWSKIATDRDCDLDLISTQDFLGRLSRGLRAAGRLA